MPTVTLREITSDTVHKVCLLKVRPDQEQFVASNAFSLAEALFAPEAWYRAVYKDELTVGFVMLWDDTLSKSPPVKPEVQVQLQVQLQVHSEAQSTKKSGVRFLLPGVIAY